VGLDIDEVARIEHAMSRPAFVERILTPKERAICNTPAKVAGRWAAKEAIAKAVRIKLRWQDVEILPNAAGAPVAQIHSLDFDSYRNRLHLSITHERHYAAAVAIVEEV
jgi:holo-[acyl-carrier-protein] synthase